MTRIECEHLIGDYLRWLKEGLRVNELETSCQISTPFLDRHNDEIEIYVEKRNGGLVLTDDGYTISDLETTGMTFETAKRKTHLQAFTFLNDAEQPVNEDNLTAIRAYDIRPLLWSHRQDALSALNGAA